MRRGLWPTIFAARRYAKSYAASRAKSCETTVSYWDRHNVATANVRVDSWYALAYRAAVPIYLRVRELRRALRLTQTELAARAGVRRATVSRLENGRVSAIDLAVLEKLADLLGVEPGFLLSRSPPRPPAG